MSKLKVCKRTLGSSNDAVSGEETLLRRVGDSREISTSSSLLLVNRNISASALRPSLRTIYDTDVMTRCRVTKEHITTISRQRAVTFDMIDRYHSALK